MAQLNIKQLNQLIGDIYQSALEPDFWPQFLGALQKSLGAQSIVLGFGGRSVNGDRLSLEASVGLCEEFANSYNEHYWKTDLILKKSTSEGLFKPGAILRSHKLCTPDELDKSDFYNEWVRAQGIEYVCAPVISLAESFSGTLTLSRTKDAGDLTDNDETLLKLLMPHMQRAFDQHKVFSGAKIENAALWDSLGQVSTAVLMIGADRKVLDANERALQITGLEDGIVIGGDNRLTVADTNGQMKLSKLVSLAVDTSQGRTIVPGGLMQVERPSGKRAFTVTVSPLSARQSVGQDKIPYAIVFVLDPDEELSASQQSLKDIYGLTPAEARLALVLASGKSLDEAAEQLGVKKNTVRTLLQRIYLKTNTNRQGELVSLILRGTLPPL